MFGKPLLLFDNMLTTAIVTATSIALGDYNLSSLSDYRPYTWWLSDYAGRYDIYIENTVNRSADYLYISGAAFNNANVLLYGYDAGFLNGVKYVDTVIDGVTEFFIDFPTVSHQSYLLRVFAPTNNALSNVWIGNKLELPRYLQRGFDPLGSSTPRGALSISAKGHPLGTAESWREWKQKILFKNIDANWLRNTWVPAFDSHLKNTPSVFVWDPVDHDTELYFIHPIVQYAAPHLAGQFANLSFFLEGLA